MHAMTMISSCLCLSGLASASQIVVDGVLDAAYGNPQAVQAAATNFENAPGGMNGWADGSELDGGWLKVDAEGGNLYLFLSGNLQSNFNKLEVFIDCIAGEGQNALRSDNPNVDYDGLNAMGEDLVNGFPGLRFDEGFAPDFFVTTTVGFNNGGCVQYANIAQLQTAGGGAGAYIGSGQFSDPMTGFNLIDDTSYGCQLSLNNSNSGGVSAPDADPLITDGCGVTTGVEMKIPLSLIGWSEGPIRVCAFINGQGHDYVSNQVLGSLPTGTGNLGGDGLGGWNGQHPTGKLRFSFASFPGNQYFSSEDGPACLQSCLADLDGSAIVDAGDIGMLLLQFGMAVPGSTRARCDLDGDAEVGAADIGLVLLSFGPCDP